MNDYIVGIDIGSSKVCAAVGRLDRQGNLQIIGITTASCHGLKKAVVIDIENTSESIRNCIEQLERMVDIKIKDAYISMPGGLSELIWNKGVVAVSSEDREIKTSDVERVLEAAKMISVPQDREIIGVLHQQFIIDGYENIKDPVGMSGLRLEVDAQVVTAQTTVISNLIKSVNRAGIRISGIVLQPSAASAVVLSKEEMEMGAALVDVGAETIEISIFKDGVLQHINMIPLGGNSITNDISLCLKLPFSESEKIKIKYGNITKEQKMTSERIKVKPANYDQIIEVDQGMLNEIMSARVEELLYLIRKRMKDSGYFDEISSVIFIGAGFSFIKGVQEMSRQIIGKSIRIGSPEYVGASSPAYAGAVGIIKEVFNRSKDIGEFEDMKEQSSAVEKAKPKKKKEKDDSGVIVKIKEFFTDFF